MRPSPVHAWGAAIVVDGVLIAEMAAEDAEEAARAVNAHEPLVAALKWVLKTAAEQLAPWEAWFEEATQRMAYHCWGCSGEFISFWPSWEKPTDATFPHDPACSYIATRAALLAANE